MKAGGGYSVPLAYVFVCVCVCGWVGVLVYAT